MGDSRGCSDEREDGAAVVVCGFALTHTNAVRDGSEFSAIDTTLRMDAELPSESLVNWESPHFAGRNEQCSAAAGFLYLLCFFCCI